MRAPRSSASGGGKLTTLPLACATYFMVAGGPYGLEDLVGQAGPRLALVVLCVTPLVWSLPTALMVGELAAALPEEGGYYAFTKRALGPFWGFLEAWLSLVASVFDMAIYPTLFALYLARVRPDLGAAYAPTLLGAGLIAVCAAWNVRGARSVGGGAVVMTIALLAPFAVLVALATTHAIARAGAAPSPAAASGAVTSGHALLAALLVAMWNYMGWDNASTVAGEVERPQRAYPLALLGAVAMVALTYVVPVLAVWASGVDVGRWETGSWVTVGERLGGRALGLAVVLGGVVCAFGMENALVLSYSRLPVALAEDGLLPRLFARRHAETAAPWVAIVACAVAYAAALPLGFDRLVELDVVLYGLSLLLEFAALVALRLREPDLARPFRVPGGLVGAALLGLPPAALIAIALWMGRNERLGDGPGSMRAVTLGALLVAAGPLVYLAAARRRRRVHVRQPGV